MSLVEWLVIHIIDCTSRFLDFGLMKHTCREERGEGSGGRGDDVRGFLKSCWWGCPSQVSAELCCITLQGVPPWPWRTACPCPPPPPHNKGARRPPLVILNMYSEAGEGGGGERQSIHGGTGWLGGNGGGVHMQDTSPVPVQLQQTTKENKQSLAGWWKNRKMES